MDTALRTRCRSDPRERALSGWAERPTRELASGLSRDNATTTSNLVTGSLLTNKLEVGEFNLIINLAEWEKVNLSELKSPRFTTPVKICLSDY